MSAMDVDTTPIGKVAADLMEDIEALHPGSEIRAVGVVVEVVSADGKVSTTEVKTDTGSRRDSRSLFYEASELYRPNGDLKP